METRVKNLRNSVIHLIFDILTLLKTDNLSGPVDELTGYLATKCESDT